MSYLDRVLLHRWFCLVGMIFCASALLELLAVPAGLAWTLVGAGALLGAAALLGLWLVRPPLRRRLRATGAAICPGCGYDLVETDVPICPECGDAWTPESARAAWRSAVGAWWPEAFQRKRL